ncbi:MAG: CusA/CzcA family heavy metal efflux RND transporter [Firmicutes bacterium]|nr:CusA/CzcA family heavy metal efflux RND transporter [Bacillota bacterium]
MAKKLITIIIRHRVICICIAILILGAGYWASRNIPLDSFPDVTPVRVEVDTEVDGMASQEVEKLITYPIEQALQGIPKVETIRSTSKFSLSVVEVVFKSGADLYWARDQVFQSLGNADLPPNVTPSIAPMAEGTGQVFIYALASKSLNNLQLRTLQDFLVKPQLRVLPGVANVPMFGGFVRQYQVNLNPAKLTSLGLGIDDVINAIKQNNQNVGGNFLARGDTQYIIRGIGFTRNLDDIGNIVISAPKGIPIRVSDVGELKIGPEVRQGAVSMNGGGETVAGIIIKRLGENTAEVIQKVKNRLDEIQNTFSAKGAKFFGIPTSDVRIITLYDQSYLIKQSVQTVTSSLTAGAILVALILLLLVGSFTASFIPIFAMIFCIMTALFFMKVNGISANLLSLGGIALSIGMMVDATVMITENVYRHMLEEEHKNLSHAEIIAIGASEILRPTFFAILVIIAVFLPVLALKGIEGQLFIPLALSVVFSMFGSLLMAVALAPSLCYWLIKSKKKEHGEPNIIIKILKKLYKSPLEISLKNPWIIAILSFLILAGSIVTLKYTGFEFLPQLEEGNFRLRFAFPPSISLPYAMEVTKRIENKVLHILPEATKVISYVGRPELGGDPESVSNDEVYIQLKPVSQWSPGITKEQMEDKLRKELQGIPGTTVQFSQELEMRTDEMISGFNTPISVYMLGDDPKTLLTFAGKIKDTLHAAGGAVDIEIEHLTGLDNLNIVPYRVKMQRYGINIGNLMDVVQGAVGGTSAGQVFLQNQRSAIQVRVQPEFRTNVDAIGRLLVTSASGISIPLHDIAKISYQTGFDHIDRWNGNRRLVITADVKDRSVLDVVNDAKNKFEKSVKLPPGYSVYWAGEAGEAESAFKNLTAAILAVMLIVFTLVYFCFDNIIDTVIVFFCIPLGIAGGTFLLWLLHLHFNVPAYIGFIANFGIAVQNGMIMVAYMNILRRQGLSAADAAMKGALVRLRPELLSALIGSIGLLPFLVASGTGATVEQPLAAVVIGGVIVSRPMAWFLIPTLYAWLKKDKP